MTRLNDPDLQIDIEMRRLKAIEQAVSAADKIILEASDGSAEETNYMTARVALRFAEKTVMPLTSALLRKDLGV